MSSHENEIGEEPRVSSQVTIRPLSQEMHASSPRRANAHYHAQVPVVRLQLGVENDNATPKKSHRTLTVRERVELFHKKHTVVKLEKALERTPGYIDTVEVDGILREVSEGAFGPVRARFVVDRDSKERAIVAKALKVIADAPNLAPIAPIQPTVSSQSTSDKTELATDVVEEDSSAAPSEISIIDSLVVGVRGMCHKVKSHSLGSPSKSATRKLRSATNVDTKGHKHSPSDMEADKTDLKAYHNSRLVTDGIAPASIDSSLATFVEPENVTNAIVSGPAGSASSGSSNVEVNTSETVPMCQTCKADADAGKAVACRITEHRHFDPAFVPKNCKRFGFFLRG